MLSENIRRVLSQTELSFVSGLDIIGGIGRKEGEWGKDMRKGRMVLRPKCNVISKGKLRFMVNMTGHNWWNLGEKRENGGKT